MSDKKSDEEESRALRSVDRNPSFTNRLGLVGGLVSFMRRQSAARFRKEVDEATAVVDSGTRLNNAKEGFWRSSARISPDNLAQIEVEEDEKITGALGAARANRAEQEMRYAEAVRRQDEFEKRNLIEDERLERELIDAQEATRAAREAAYGRKSPHDEKPSREILGEQIEDTLRRLGELDADWEKKVENGTDTESAEHIYNMKRNRINEQIERLQAELDAL